MRWLHRLMYDGQQLLSQLIQVHLIAQSRTEGCYDLRCVILVTVEASVDDYLDTPAQGLEEVIDDKRGDNDSYRGGLIKEPSQEHS
ncbi:MAG: hypothetical protein E6J04_20625 [Chloroflexi bacterium]|nr:MAG: hypothetical protein E6J04_20625 [Chloroflexota bacterium]